MMLMNLVKYYSTSVSFFGLIIMGKFFFALKCQAFLLAYMYCEETVFFLRPNEYF